MEFEKRPYADAAVGALRRLLAEHKRVIAVGPTGCGKTAIAAQLIKSTPRWRRVLWLAHRYELVDQAFTTIAELDMHVGVTMEADERINGIDRHFPGARITVASVQTVTARGIPEGVDLIVFDEAHRTMADSYQAIARSAPAAEILGLTATPCRIDGKGLGDFYCHMHIIAQPSALYPVYLSEPRTYSAPADVIAEIAKRTQGVRSVGGDFNPGGLARAVNTRYLIGHVVDEAMRLAPGVAKVAFACSIEHSKGIADDFARAGVRSVHIDKSTPAEERKAALDALRAGSVEVVCNVDVLSEGWDLPSLGAVVIARPTRSLARFLQMVGRVQRVHGDRVPIVIDHGANVQRLDVVPGQDIEWSLDRGAPRRTGTAVAKVCPGCAMCIPNGCRVCPGCASEQPEQEQEREVIAARLEEVKRERIARARAGVEALAAKKNAPPGWVDKVMEMYAR